ncbi:MAG: type IV pilus twitching motility protein PilT [Bdellovibrionota bacterium]
MNELEKKFLALLQAAVQNNSSDIHLATGQSPSIRAGDGLVSVNLPPFTAEEMDVICKFMLSDPKQKAAFGESQDLDGSFEVKGLGRFRFNMYRSVAGRCAVLRVIASKVPTLAELKLPEQLKKIASAARGLVLVTGATGSGKSSTLAAMVNFINETEALHILTVEDPIEFLHTQKKSRISQREIGRDTASFANALKSALRQDPDVILVGEMRDIETLDIALKAAETGHLVFSTVHTSDAMKTIGRLISLYPAGEQNSARVRLADNLHAVISQRLIPVAGGRKVVAQEIMVNNLGIQECILNEKKTCEIPSFIEKGKEVSGMQTFDQHLGDLVKARLIDMDTALAYATNPSDFQRNFSFGGTASIEDDSAPAHAQEDGLVLESADSPTPENPIAEAATFRPPAGGKPGLAPLPPALGRTAPGKTNPGITNPGIKKPGAA